MSKKRVLSGIQPSGDLRLPFKGDNLKGGEGVRLVYMAPPDARRAGDTLSAGPAATAAAD